MAQRHGLSVGEVLAVGADESLECQRSEQLGKRAYGRGQGQPNGQRRGNLPHRFPVLPRIAAEEKEQQSQEGTSYNRLGVTHYHVIDAR